MNWSQRSKSGMSTNRGVFEEQLQDRIDRDRLELSQSLIDVADSLRGKERFHSWNKPSEEARRQVEIICQYYHVLTPEEIPKTSNINDMIGYITQPLGVMHRRVQLNEKWWKNGDGALLAVFKESGQVIALLPGTISGYVYRDDKTGKRIRVTAENEGLFEREAQCFYRPLPRKKMSGKDLIIFLVRNIPRSDYLLIVLASLFITIVGLITPNITRIIFAEIIPTGTLELVISMSVLLFSATVATYLISVVRTGLLERVRERMSVLLQNAVMGRVIHLPAKFFQGKSSGSLSQSIISLKILPQALTDAVMGPGITAVLSIVYVVQIVVIAPSFAFPAFATLVVQALIIILSTKQKMRLVGEELEGDMKTQGITYSMITGIQRIKLSGSENRMLARWAKVYKEKAGSAYRPHFPSVIQNELVTATALLGTLWVYFAGVRDGSTDVSQFAAFLAAFSMSTANLTLFSQSGQLLAYIRPILNMIAPVLSEMPETSIGKKTVSGLKGGITLSHVSFRYSKNRPLILDDIDLKINPGEYVAVVGKSGCGKSTLLRLLLGFEEPEIGTISYDNVNMENIDLGSLRRNIGTVLQNGKLFAGDIFSNITISAPWLTMKDAWEAAKLAGIDGVIKNMPMGMHTLISEGGGGISGGQKQRLLIARAIAPKPNILMFDEATSALDNITQKIVSDSLESLKCTRIVIAHRLSTIRHCDRIIVLDKGKIIEDGSYDELINANGFFADLVSRQKT